MSLFSNSRGSFHFFCLPDDSPFSTPKALENRFKLDLPASERNFIKKAIAERSQQLLLVRDGRGRVVFIMPSLSYSTGFLLAFYPDFGIPVRAFFALGDLKCDILQSPRFLRAKDTAEDNGWTDAGRIDTVSRLLNLNYFISCGVDYNINAHDIAEKAFTFTASLAELYGITLRIFREYPHPVCSPTFDRGVFCMMVISAYNAAAKFLHTGSPVMRIFLDEKDEVCFSIRFFGELGRELDALAEAAERCRMPMLFERKAESLLVLSPVRPEISLLGIKEDWQRKKKMESPYLFDPD